MARTPVAVLAAAAFTAASLGSSAVRAQDHSIIRSPGDHPPYIFEAEPELLLGYGGPFLENDNFGVGFRGAFHIADGFVPTINDSVAIGFGFDIATEGRVWVPIYLQWNFWLTRHWSVFGEPGFGIGSNPGNAIWPNFSIGARFHFTDRITLTMRVGYPAVSIGVSFLL